ncbi:MAG: hypothetical protein JNN15_07465, partial [Blastocatellia bacterium]|nr:hypothetical protein [Blastocatellia bacterium]
MKKWGTSNRQALLLVLIATIIFSTEAIVLRLAAKHGLQMGQIAVAQCAAAAATQFLFGAKISKVALKNWWLPLLMAAGSGLAFYLAIRTAPAAIVALIEPLGLIPLAIGHRVLLKKTIS